jgi:hypothetical protein
VESSGVLILVEDEAEPCRLAIERGEEVEDDAPSLFSASDEVVSWAGLGLVDVVWLLGFVWAAVACFAW